MYCMNNQTFIDRYIDISDQLVPGKVLVIYGPRRCGKTTLLTKLMQDTSKKFVFYRGDDLSVQQDFSVASEQKLKEKVGKSEILIIDEAQMIPNIGASLKLLVDSMPELRVVVTGSSAFELAGQIGEPLTGRKITKYLLPLSVSELTIDQNAPEHFVNTNLENYLIYGMYPDTITAKADDEKVDFLSELVDSYLLKDILAFQDVKGSRILFQLLNLLAYQIGGEVSLTELGSQLGIDKKTVDRYLDLLEKSYIIYRLGGYSRNLRSEITKKPKYYFYDNGVRNALIGNFNKLEIRNDIGQLWENFAMTERLKKIKYFGPRTNSYFWRTWAGQEVDLVEERDGKLHGFEMKWKYNDRNHAPKAWLETYPDQSTWKQMSPDQLLEFTNR